jgi:hypothetical protein
MLTIHSKKKRGYKLFCLNIYFGALKMWQKHREYEVVFDTFCHGFQYTENVTDYIFNFLNS